MLVLKNSLTSKLFTFFSPAAVVNHVSNDVVLNSFIREGRQQQQQQQLLLPINIFYIENFPSFVTPQCRKLRQLCQELNMTLC